MSAQKSGRSEYKEPTEHLTKYGYASCILNGNTVEGGLRSLTYKSVYALKLVEELNLAKYAVIPSEPEILLLGNTKLTADHVSALRADIDGLTSKSGTRDTTADQMVDMFNSRLDKELLESKNISDDYQKLLLDMCGDSVTDNSVTFKRFISNEPVATMEEVEGFDGTMYHQAAERRRQEERLENEKLALEAQKLEEEAMIEELKYREHEKVRNEAAQMRDNDISVNLAMHVDPPAVPNAPSVVSDLSFNVDNNLEYSSQSGSYSTTPAN